MGTGVVRRFSAGHLAMLAAGLVGTAATLVVLRGDEPRTAVVVAAHPLRAGDEIARDALTTAEIAPDDRLADHLVAAADIDELLGLVVVAPIDSGSPVLPEQLLAPAEDGRRTMSFAVDPERAVDGAVAAGDRIDVLAVDSDGRVGYAVVDALVTERSRADDDAPLRGGDAGAITLTVAVDADAARRLAAAVATGEITVVRATGAEPVADVVWFGAEPDITLERGAPDA